MRRLSPTQQKILLVLMGGVALGLTTSPNEYYRKLRKIRKEWNRINQYSFTRSVKKLCNQKILQEVRLKNGDFKLVLTPEGKKLTKWYQLRDKAIKFAKPPKKWDGKWRVVIFDIPEENRSFRAVLREHLYYLKFHKLQHSVFVSPYPYEKQLKELVEIYGATKYVRIITATFIDNERELRKKFGL